jgi:hypothetical protein
MGIIRLVVGAWFIIDIILSKCTVPNHVIIIKTKVPFPRA